jgi:hypothetical protein
MVKHLQMKMLLLVAMLMGWGVSAGADGTLVSALTSIEEGTYYITALSSNKYYTVPNTTISGQTFNCLEATLNDNVLTTPTGAGEFVFTPVSGVDNAYYIYNTNLQKYLVATGSKAFGYVDNTSNDYGYWTFSNVSSGGFSGLFSVKHSDKSHYMRAYNNTVRCYDGASNNGIYLFKKVENQNAVATPTIEPDGGAFVSSQEVSISCTTADATIYYTLDGNTPTANSTQYTGKFSITETTTVKAIAVKADMSNSSVATAVFTKVVPLTNIAALTTKTETGTYYVTLTNAVVTFANGNNAYIQDESGAVAMYKSGHTLKAGDVLNGIATITYQVRNGNPQITDLSGVTPTSGNAPEPTTIAASAWNYTFNNVLSQYFTITDVTITQTDGKYYITLGNDNVQLYKAGGSISSLNLQQSYNVTGFPTLYNSVKELQIFSDPENAEPNISIATTTITAPCDGVNGTLVVTYKNIADATYGVQFCDANGDALEGDAPDWVKLSFDNDHNVSYTITINENNDKARTAYFKVYAEVNQKTVYSNLVTINQAKYVAPYATLPFEFNGGKADIEDTGGLSQEGLGSDYANDANTKLKFDNTGDWLLLRIAEDDVPGTLTYDIKSNGFSGGTFKVQVSEDGEVYTDLKSYTEISGTQNEELAINPNVRYIKWIYTTKSTGNVGLGNIKLTKQTAPVWSNNLPSSVVIERSEPYVLNLRELVSGAPAPTISLTTTVNEELYTFEDDEFSFAADASGDYSFAFKAENGAGIATANLTVTVKQPTAYALTVTNLENVELYVFDAADQNNPLILDGQPGEVQVYNGTQVMISVSALEGYHLQSVLVGNDEVIDELDESGAYTFTMPTSSVTISAKAIEPAPSVTYTLASSITPGKKYIIVGFNNDKAYAMGEQKTNNRGAVEVTVANDEITVASYGVYEFEINDLNESNNNGELYSIYDNRANEDEGGYLYAAGSSNNYLKTEAELNANGKWTISFNKDGFASIVAQGENSRNVMQFNSTSNLFSCYGSASQSPVYLYEKVEEEQPLTKTITDAQWATYVAPKTVMIPDGLKAYIVTAASTQNGVTLTPIQSAEEGTPVVLNGTANTYTFVETGEQADDTSANLLCVVTANTPNITEAYVLAKPNAEAEVKFYHYVNANDPLDEGQVYLPVEYVRGNGNGVRELDIDVPSSISTMSIGQSAMNNTVYDLQGRTVVQPTKGLYIVNGKKVIIK